MLGPDAATRLRRGEPTAGALTATLSCSMLGPDAGAHPDTGAPNDRRKLTFWCGDERQELALGAGAFFVGGARAAGAIFAGVDAGVLAWVGGLGAILGAALGVNVMSAGAGAGKTWVLVGACAVAAKVADARTAKTTAEKVDREADIVAMVCPLPISLALRDD